jgi:putative ABC transport system permease protein
MLKNYLKIAFRNILRHKGFSFINITGLAAGIACCMLIMLYVQDELSYDRYHEKIDRLYRLERTGVLQDQVYHVPVTAHPTGPAFENDLPEILQAVRLWPTQLTVKNWNNHYFEEKIFFTDAAIFNTFTFPLLKGSPGSALKEPNSIVLTERMSKKYFNDIDSIGKTLSIKWGENTIDFKVTGIMKQIPGNSHFKTDFFASYTTLNKLIGSQLNQWLSNSVYTYLLLANNVSPGELEKKFPLLVEKYMGKSVRKFLGAEVDISSLMKFVLRPVSEIHLYSHLQWEIEPNGNINTVYIFSVIAFLVLLIACINFMNLSTARSANRAKEVGLRKTVGANKRLLVKQFIGESLFLAFIAGIIAVLLVQSLLPMYNAITLKEMSNKYLTDPLSIVLFIAVILFVGLVSGSYPAFYLSSFQPVKVMRVTPGKGTDNRSQLLRKGLVVLQFTISIVLIIGTIVVMNQLKFLKNKNLGFKKEQVLVIPAKDNSLLNKYDSIKFELLKNTKILTVTTSSRIPGNRNFPDRVFLREGMNSDQVKDIIFFHIDTDFIPLLEIELSAGRNYSKDFTTDKTEGLILNESAVKKFGWETPEMAIGKGILIPDSPGKYKKTKIVGVVKDFHFKSLHQKIEPLILFLDPNQVNFVTVKIAVEDIPSTVAYLEKKFKAFSPGFDFDYFFLDNNFDQLYRSEERIQTIFNFFTFLAILISCLGLFGLASYTAERRTKEMGIRKVLGATVPNIIAQLSKSFIIWVAIANLIAWPAAFIAMNKWLQNFAYRTDIGIGIFILSGIIALVIALLTVSYQCIKTALANPIHALKYE